MAGQNSKKLQGTKRIFYVKSSPNSSRAFTDLQRSSFDKSYRDIEAIEAQLPATISLSQALATGHLLCVASRTVDRYILFHRHIMNQYIIYYIPYYVLKLHCYTLACRIILHVTTIYIYI